MSVIEILAAVLLLAGSTLIIRALIAADLADRTATSPREADGRAEDMRRAA
ncbi:MAG TPA: hypothetical protein VLI67_03620 [Vicinamibacteria bacterium]|nr:hypothetical protein [Vicinamibacteria bacterium]